MTKPISPATIAFVDGQNLFHSAREAFGYSFPNYDVVKLAGRICEARGWVLKHVQFYTGVPDAHESPRWHHFWARKLLAMKRLGVHVYSRPLRYRNKSVNLPGGSVHTFPVAEEKGIDVRIAVDIIRAAHRRECDVALVFSQDQDLSEVAEEIRVIAKEQGRWINIASAYPVSPTTRNRRGIQKTDWIRIDRELYDACVDNRNYRTES